MTACPSTTRTVLTRTGAMAVVFGTTFGLVLGPTLAMAQDAAPSTVFAVINDDGSVKDVDRLGSDEAPGDLPVSVKITEAEDGDTTTTSYTVENTTVEKQTISYLGADGKPMTAEQDVALPLVAQLSVMLPSSRKDVSALGARINKLADGSTELVWSMVLFGPIGSPVSDVSFSSTGDGDPVARLDVAAVQPNATPGMSAVGQAANATVNGNGILNTVATGANEGLVKLSAGVGDLLVGLEKLYAGAQQLNTGIEAAVDGANQLADGSEAAEAGSGELSAGLGKIAAGGDALSAGAGQLNAGAGKIVQGLDAANTGAVQLAAGSKELSTGATAAAAGAKSLSDGLALISGGLNQLSAAQGLPAALDGAKKLQVGVDALRAGLGSPTTAGTLLNGVAQLAGGLTQVQGGLGGLAAGLPSAQGGVDQILAGLLDALKTGGSIDQLSGGLSAAKSYVGQALVEAACTPPAATPTVTIGTLDASPCNELFVTSGTLTALIAGVENAANATTPPAPTDGLRKKTKDSANGLAAISSGLGTAIGGVGQLQAGVAALQTGTTALNGGLQQIAAGLKSGDPTKPGIAEGLSALVTGLTTAVGGVTQLSTGATTAATGAKALADGNAALAAGAAKIAAGNTALASGTSQLFTGSKELQAGTTKLAAGAKELAAGANKAYTGAQDLNAGLGKIADGQRKVADGLPAAADGSGQIADGLGQVVAGAPKVAQGLSDVRTKAVETLQSQFKQGTELARQQLAGLDASSAMITTTAGAANTTWILTQDEDGNISLASGESDSDLGRNVAIGVGGALLLMGGLAGGFVAGRRQGV